MPDILVVKVNVLLRSKDMNDLDKYIRNSVKTGVVILPPYCDAQVVPDNVEVRIKNVFERKGDSYVKD